MKVQEQDAVMLKLHELVQRYRSWDVGFRSSSGRAMKGMGAFMAIAALMLLAGSWVIGEDAPGDHLRWFCFAVIGVSWYGYGVYQLRISEVLPVLRQLAAEYPPDSGELNS